MIGAREWTHADGARLSSRRHCEVDAAAETTWCPRNGPVSRRKPSITPGDQQGQHLNTLRVLAIACRGRLPVSRHGARRPRRAAHHRICHPEFRVGDFVRSKSEWTQADDK
ncbi:hypothetical protein D9M69_160650 [compost metagenome]